MAGEIAQDVAVMMAVSSAAIGASGAIIAQVVAGVITGRRERTKAEAETERWRSEAEAKRRDRQLDRKIELFTRFLSTGDVLLNPTLWQLEGDTSARSAKRNEASEHLRTMSQEIGILAPELYDHARSVSTSALMAVVTFLIEESDVEQDAEKLPTSKARVDEMRKSFSLWHQAFRKVTHSYISHEAVPAHEDAIEVHKKELKEALADR